MLLHMVFSTRCSGCNPEGLACRPVHTQIVCYCIWWSALGVVVVIPRGWRVVLCTVCTGLHTSPLGLQPLHLVLTTICSNIQSVCAQDYTSALRITTATPSAEHHMQ